MATTATPGTCVGPRAGGPALRGRGSGKARGRHSLEAARQAGHRICVVVGDPSYYRPFGFIPASGQGLSLPGPVEPERFQVKALVPGALVGVHGVIARGETAAPPAAAKPQRRRDRKSTRLNSSH